MVAYLIGNQCRQLDHYCLLRHIYACFVLHNFCESRNENVQDDLVRCTMEYEREFQPAMEPVRMTANKSEAEGKKIRNILMKYFDP